MNNFSHFICQADTDQFPDLYQIHLLVALCESNQLKFILKISLLCLLLLICIIMREFAEAIVRDSIASQLQINITEDGPFPQRKQMFINLKFHWGRATKINRSQKQQIEDSWEGKTHFLSAWWNLDDQGFSGIFFPLQKVYFCLSLLKRRAWKPDDILCLIVRIPTWSGFRFLSTVGGPSAVLFLSLLEERGQGTSEEQSEKLAWKML